jgi:hypothetical protein
VCAGARAAGPWRMSAALRPRPRPASILVACALALLLPAPAAAKLPAAVPLRLACEACNGTLLELRKHVSAQRHRLGLGAHAVATVARTAVQRNFDSISPHAENAVTDALETVCAEGHRIFAAYSVPPLKMKQACVARSLRAPRAFDEPPPLRALRRRSRRAAALRWWSTSRRRCRRRCTAARRTRHCTRACACRCATTRRETPSRRRLRTCVPLLRLARNGAAKPHRPAMPRVFTLLPCHGIT